MSFDLESLGGGAGAGLIGTILGILGMNKENKRRLANLEVAKQDVKVCNAFHQGIDNRFSTVIETQKEIKDELRDLNNYIRKVGYPD